MGEAEWRCRIGRVTRKGGATVRVLRPEKDGSPAEVIGALREGVDKLAEYFEADAAGYVVVMWDRAGRYSRGWRNSASSPYARRLVPGIVKDILAQDIMAGVTRDVLNGEA